MIKKMPSNKYKLTLTIDEDAVQQVKQILPEGGVSDKVEKFFQRIAQEGEWFEELISIEIYNDQLVGLQEAIDRVEVKIAAEEDHIRELKTSIGSLYQTKNSILESLRVIEGKMLNDKGIMAKRKAIALFGVMCEKHLYNEEEIKNSDDGKEVIDILENLGMLKNDEELKRRVNIAEKLNEYNRAVMNA